MRAKPVLARRRAHDVAARAVFAAAMLAANIGSAAPADTIDTTGQPPYERCGYCHEIDGNPRMPEFPRLAGQQVGYLVKQLKDFRAGRRHGTMQATAELLSDEDIAEVARYFHAQPLRATPVAPAPASSLDIAERLLRHGDPARGILPCRSCHGADGKGMDATPRLANQHAAYVETQLHDFRRGARRNDAGGVMRAVVARLTDPEMHALAQYFELMSIR